MVTKHDLTMNQRRNACKVMEFPPCIQTGDGAAFDMQLSNKVSYTIFNAFWVSLPYLVTHIVIPGL